MNSPDSLLELYRLAAMQARASPRSSDEHALYVAELMREVPRVINMLGAFYDGLPKSVQNGLDSRKARRKLTATNLEETIARGDHLWESIYRPHATKLTAKLAQSHPDLPLHILESEYGSLFTDPASSLTPENAHCPDIGRILMSVTAIACLRAQPGVGPQVVSHVYGLRKAFADGTAESETDVPGGKWLASDEGSIWLLELVDRIVDAINGAKSTTFSPGLRNPSTSKF
ncbi:hypothetical protein MRB53_042014 [Persea americana]|nr:hypothetical protein MRB53_042014 [Persea americana]